MIDREGTLPLCKATEREQQWIHSAFRSSSSKVQGGELAQVSKTTAKYWICQAFSCWLHGKPTWPEKKSRPKTASRLDHNVCRCFSILQTDYRCIF